MSRYTFCTDHTHCRATKSFWFWKIKVRLRCANELSLLEDASIKVMWERFWSRVKGWRGIRKKHNHLSCRRMGLSPKGCCVVSWNASKMKEGIRQDKNKVAELEMELVWRLSSALSTEDTRQLQDGVVGADSLTEHWDLTRMTLLSGKFDPLPPFSCTFPSSSPHRLLLPDFPFPAALSTGKYLLPRLPFPSYHVCQRLGK